MTKTGTRTPRPTAGEHVQLQRRQRSRRGAAGAVAAVATLGLILAGATPPPAYAAEAPAWEFATAQDVQGWTSGPGTEAVVATADGLEVRVTPPDPWISSSPFEVAASEFNTIVIHAQNATTNTLGKVYWETAESPWFSESRSKTFELRPEETEPGEYRVDLRGLGSWSGTIQRLRIDPGENATASGLVTIQSIGFAVNDVPLPQPEDGDRQPVDHIGGVAPIVATGDEIIVTGDLPDDGENDLSLLELDPWEYELDFADGIALDTATATGEFSFTVPRFDAGRDRLFSKFLVVSDADGEARFVDSARYATELEFPSAHEFEFPAPATKKGLQVQLTDDADELGVGHAAINIAFDQALLPADEGPDKTIPFESSGDTYFFDRQYMDELDRTIKPLSDNGMLVNAILIVYDDAKSNAGAPDLLIHPAADRGQGTVFAFNTVDEKSRYFRAVLEFLAQRYTQEDQSHGRVVGWIVGNEVNSQWVWQNRGETSMNQFVDDYENALRWTHLAVTKQYKPARTYVSLDHQWNERLNSAEPTRWYPGKAVLDQLVKVTDESGSFGWHVAYHPYPEDLFDPATWNDASAIDSFDTPKITFKNLHLLGQYLQRDDLMFEGEQRRIILSEQGFHAPANSGEGEDLQAAAYAYGYYRAVSTPGIDSFILHRHVDHKNEGGLRLGLWTWDDDRSEPSSPDEQRRIYDVFRYIDTPAAREHTEFALPIIGADSWESLFPGLDVDSQGVRPLPVVAPLDIRSDTVATDLALVADQWDAGDNVTGVSTGGDTATATFDVLDKQWRGLTQSFPDGLDASLSPLLQVGLDVPGTTADSLRTAKVKVYSGPHVAEGTVRLAGEDTVVTLDLGAWEQRAEIDRVKVWVSGQSNADWDGEFSVSAAGFTATPAAVDAANLTVEASSSELSEGGAIDLSVTNLGGSPQVGTLEVLDTGTVTLDERTVPFDSLDALATADLTATIATVAEGSPALHLEFDGRRYVVPVALVQATLPPANVRLLYSFEGDTEGWVAGEGTARLAASRTMANSPGVPKLGEYALAARSQNIAANRWRTVSVHPDQAVDSAGAEALVGWVNGYGGMGNSYEGRIAITTTADEYERVQAIVPDRWNKLRLPLADVEGDITSIAVSFRAVGVTTSWNPEFQVDLVGLELAITPEDTTAPVVSGVPSGVVNAEDGLDLAIVANDPESGLRSLAVTFDGTEIPVTGPVDLSGLAGERTVVVTAVNGIGLETIVSETLLVVPADDASAAPGAAILSNSSGHAWGLHDGNYAVNLNLWWGVPGSVYRLYENDALVETRVVEPEPGTHQSLSHPVADKPNGTYIYRAELINSKGVTASNSTVVEVTAATPGAVIVSHDNWDRDGRFTVTADMWWGTNATAYTFALDGDIVAEGTLSIRPPNAQRATVTLTDIAEGTHAIVATFTNAQGDSVSTPVDVIVER